MPHRWGCSPPFAGRSGRVDGLCDQPKTHSFRLGGNGLTAGQAGLTHFIGSIVYDERALSTVTSQEAMLVIDGQQRLTTSSLLIAALANHIEQADLGEPLEGFSARKLRNYYLLNPDEEGKCHFKLLLAEVDRDTLLSILQATPAPAEASTRILENFQVFQDLIKEHAAELVTDKAGNPIGLAHSPLKMNRGMAQVPVWNDAAIQARADRLATEATKVWQAPTLPADVLAAYRPGKQGTQYSISDHPNLSGGAMAALFPDLRQRIIGIDPCVTEEFLKLYVAYKGRSQLRRRGAAGQAPAPVAEPGLPRD